MIVCPVCGDPPSSCTNDRTASDGRRYCKYKCACKTVHFLHEEDRSGPRFFWMTVMDEEDARWPQVEYRHRRDPDGNERTSVVLGDGGITHMDVEGEAAGEAVANISAACTVRRVMGS